MRRIVIFIAILASLNSNLLLSKILHISFHKGCIRELEFVAQELSWNLTSMYVHDLPQGEFDGKTKGSGIYNIGHERALNIWNKHKAYFNQFDTIITSDTAPLARIFLQNNYSGRLIIWVCNRFDYCDQASLDCKFPDSEYYSLINLAKNSPHTTIISYNDFEPVYAKTKAVDLGSTLIKPCGFNWGNPSSISPNIDKKGTFFVPPYHSNASFKTVEKCLAHQISALSGYYNGPTAIKEFKGIIHIPCAWSNFAMFENLANGLIHFIPSQQYMLKLLSEGAHFPDGNFTKKHLNLSEWYHPELKEVLIYFESITDLKHKINTLDFDKQKQRCLAFAQNHKASMLNRWEKIIIPGEKI